MSAIASYFQWSSLLTIIISFMAGVMTKVGYYRFKGRKIYAPFIERSSTNFTMMAIALALMSTFTVVSTTIASDKAVNCEVQFQTALAYNAKVNQDDKPIAMQLDDLEDQDRAALRKTLQDITLAQSPEESLKTLTTFLDTTNQIEIKRVGLNDQRRQLNDTRQAYPEPHCGLD